MRRRPGQVAGGDTRRGDAQAHAGEHALARDDQGAAAGLDGVGDAVDAVGGETASAVLGGDGGGCGAHGATEAGERERGRVVDAAADHDGRPAVDDDLALLARLRAWRRRHKHDPSRVPRVRRAR